MSNNKPSFTAYVASFIVLLVAAVFTYFTWIAEQPCDMDKIYFWCHVHPVKPIDIIGYIMFLGGVIYSCYIWLFKSDSISDSLLFNYGGIAVAMLGVILMWA